MDGILGLAHFCETHGPCIILCTQRSEQEPQQCPPDLSVPWCEACQSIELDQAMVSREEHIYYVTTRTALQQDLAFLLKHAAVRSLSCEETNKAGGTMYFGDNERGHILSHSFILQDSLARGFYRKYSVLMVMRDKLHLLNRWEYLTSHIKKIATELSTKAANINNVEQTKCSQRAVRQAQGSPTNPARSLSQLTGEPAVFAHLHMWFTWLLSCETVIEKPTKVPEIPIDCTPRPLQQLHEEMDNEVFQTVTYCILTGIRVVCDNELVLGAFKQLLPNKWDLPKTGQIVCLKNTDGWIIEWRGNLPTKLPKLQVLIQEALGNKDFPINALQAYLTSIILHWYNKAKTFALINNLQNNALLQAMGIQKCDLPLLAYWTAQCRNEK